VGSTAVHPEVIRTEVTELLGVGVDAGAEAPPAAEPAAPDVDATADAFPLAATQHELWLGRHDEQQVGGVGKRPDWLTDELWLGGRGKARGYRGSPNPIADRFAEHGGRVGYRTELAVRAGCANPVVLSGIRGVG
jgi:hypothetical protein